jgi:CBS domain-containing protein
MATPASTPAVSLSDHAAAAAYLMNHAGATALVVLDGHWRGSPAGIITSADLFRAVAAGEDLDDIRIEHVLKARTTSQAEL